MTTNLIEYITPNKIDLDSESPDDDSEYMTSPEANRQRVLATKNEQDYSNDEIGSNFNGLYRRFSGIPQKLF